MWILHNRSFPEKRKLDFFNHWTIKKVIWRCNFQSIVAIILYYLPNSSTALKPGYRERLLQIPDRILRNPDLHNYVVLGGTSLEWIKAGIKRFISVNLFSKPFELFWIKMPNCTPYLNVLKELVEQPEHGISVSDLTRDDNGICKCLYRISRQIATA